MDIEDLLSQAKLVSEAMQQNKAQPNFALQDEAVKAIQDMASSPMNTFDSKPLQQLADYETGSKFSYNQRAPQTVADVVNASSGMLNPKNDYMKEALSAISKLQGAQNRQNANDARDRHFQEKNNQEETKYVWSLYNPERKALDDADRQMKNIEAAIASGKPERVTGALSQFARLMGEKGSLSDSDIGRSFQSSLPVSLGQFISRLGDKSYQVDPSQFENLKASLADARASMGNISKAKFAEMRQSLANSPYATGFQSLDQDGGIIRGTESIANKFLNATSSATPKDESPKMRKNPFRD